MTAAAFRQAHATSADGTKIAVTITGRGRPLVVSPGALNAAQDWPILANLPAPHVTTHAIDRRGPGRQRRQRRAPHRSWSLSPICGPDARIGVHGSRLGREGLVDEVRVQLSATADVGPLALITVSPSRQQSGVPVPEPFETVIDGRGMPDRASP